MIFFFLVSDEDFFEKCVFIGENDELYDEIEIFFEKQERFELIHMFLNLFYFILFL